MKVIGVLAFLGLLFHVQGLQESSCRTSGGRCQNDRRACSGRYQSGLCRGGSRRRCCLPSSRQSSSSSSSGGSDAPCQNQGGTCQSDTGACSGHYQSGLCSGASNRRCCVPSSSAAHSGSGSYNCFGDFMNLHPTGASAQTAHQDGITHGGVLASQRMVSTDYHELNKLKNCYVQAGQNNCVHPAVIAGIASRETRGGAVIASTGGWGDHHRAYGIMQCDVVASGLGPQCTAYPWNSCQHIDMMVRILLVPYVHTMQSKHSSWAPEQQLQGAVSGYNAGTGNVRTFSGMDQGTTGNDYSNDVMARAQYLVSHYGW